MSSMSKVSVNDSASKHLEAFTQALHKVISSQPTQRAVAQVVDGIPTRTDSNGWEFVKASLKRKDDPSEESIETVRAFQESFKVETLESSSDVRSWSLDPLYTSTNPCIGCTSISRYLNRIEEL